MSLTRLSGARNQAEPPGDGWAEASMAPDANLGYPHDLAAVTARVTHAFQPIVSTRSLRVHGFEALARLPQDCGFGSAHQLLDAAWKGGHLRLIERCLLTRAIERFAKLDGAASSRLFCNLDNRVFDDANVSARALVAIAEASGLAPANICIELSERQPPASVEAFGRMVDLFLRHNLRIAIDDFGQGFSGLHMLLKVEPHYVKIDRLFIDGLAGSPRKQAIVAKITALAHSLGFIVVAEGVETEADFRSAREIGCDLAQGFLIARPTLDLRELQMSYGAIGTCPANPSSIPPRLGELIEAPRPLSLDEPLLTVVKRFKSAPRTRLIPVVDSHDYVHGAVYEEDIRRYLYSDFGAALLANRGISPQVSSLTRRCPMGEVAAPIEAIVESYVVAESTAGMVLTADGRYVGYLSNHAVLQLATEREIAAARDQNPLTHLPGNTTTAHHIERLLKSGGQHAIAFFDFDHFKAFNDTYGFIAGDRALQLFGDILLKERRASGAFVGHIGGDDFLLATDVPDSEALVRRIAERFAGDAANLYKPDDRARGGIEAPDRFGKVRFFPLLRASVALLRLPHSRSHLTAEDVTTTLALAKAAAKNSPDGFAHAQLPPTPVHKAIGRITHPL